MMFSKKLVVGSLILATGLLIFMLSRRINSRPHVSAEVENVVDRVGKIPLRVNRTPMMVDIPHIESYDPEVVAGKIVATVLENKSSPSAIVHSSKLAPIVGSHVLDWLQKNEFGTVVQVNLDDALFQKSWRGLEGKRTETEKHSGHRDHLLSLLAEQGVSLECPLAHESERGGGTVRDLLRAAVSEFHLNQVELPWTATALVLYLPPQRSWTNRFGEEFDFDMLAMELMERPLRNASCAGLHIVQTLTLIAKVDEERGILLPETQQRLQEYLVTQVNQAIHSQQDDGSWPAEWTNFGMHDETETSRSAPSTPETKLMIASHLLEWFHHLPAELQPPKYVFRRGAVWASVRVASMSDNEIENEVCPCTHVILAIFDTMHRNQK